MKGLRRVRSIVIGLAFGACLGLALSYGQDHAREPLGILALSTVALVVVGWVMSYVGMRRAVGSRFSIGWGFFQRSSHPFEVLSLPEAELMWDALGQRREALLGGWRCHGHCDVKMFVGELGGRRYYLYTDAMTERPWVQWVFGYLIAFGKDAPMSHVPTEEIVGA